MVWPCDGEELKEEENGKARKGVNAVMIIEKYGKRRHVAPTPV